MGNLANKINLHVVTLDKGMINEESLLPIFETDSDFQEGEGKRLSKKIFKKFKDLEETEMVESMIAELFTIPNFIGESTYYGDYEYDITETEFSYVVSIAFIN